MTPSLLVMLGVGKLETPLSIAWIEQLELMRRKALPMIAVSPDPVPSVLLDTQKSPDLRHLITTLRTVPDTRLSFLAAWCGLIASDLSVAETLLLITMISPLTCTLTLRFHLLRHHATLVRIEQVRHLTLCTTTPQESVQLALDIPDLGEQLAQVRVYQAARRLQGDA